MWQMTPPREPAYPLSMLVARTAALSPAAPGGWIKASAEAARQRAWPAKERPIPAIQAHIHLDPDL